MMALDDFILFETLYPKEWRQLQYNRFISTKHDAKANQSGAF